MMRTKKAKKPDLADILMPAEYFAQKSTHPSVQSEPPRVVRFAGKETTVERIKATSAMLRYYRAFLASDQSRYAECRDVNSDWHHDTLNRVQCRARLSMLVNVAINRKAGIPDHESDIDLWRDCQLLQHILRGNNPSALQWWYSNLRKFRTRWIHRRYGATLAEFTRQRNEDW